MVLKLEQFGFTMQDGDGMVTSVDSEQSLIWICSVGTDQCIPRAVDKRECLMLIQG